MTRFYVNFLNLRWDPVLILAIEPKPIKPPDSLVSRRLAARFKATLAQGEWDVCYAKGIVLDPGENEDMFDRLQREGLVKDRYQVWPDLDGEQEDYGLWIELTGLTAKHAQRLIESTTNPKDRKLENFPIVMGSDWEPIRFMRNLTHS
jgi:hypothetical protein